MTSGIRLSPTHGVNPSIAQCFYCLGDKNEIILFGKLKGGDKEAPHRACIDRIPCDTCADYMKQGVILISCKDSDQGNQNPNRTGGWVVIKEEAVRRMITNETLADTICKARVAFVPDATWSALELPYSDTPTTP